eukprot:scaffold172392_cov30-Tisochrysis_lutea.AAC.4
MWQALHTCLSTSTRSFSGAISPAIRRSDSASVYWPSSVRAVARRTYALSKVGGGGRRAASSSRKVEISMARDAS